MIFTSEDGRRYDTNSLIKINAQTGPLSILSDRIFDKDRITKREHSLWRYLHMLPVNEAFMKSMGEGWTPLTTIEIAGRPILVKHEQLAPSGSYKDRGSAVLMAYLKQMGVKEVVQDSSGNAGASIAAYAALHGIACTIVVPQNTSPAKLRQIAHYGAQIIQLNGSRQDAAAKALELADHLPYASHCYHPMFFEGTKTLAYEIAEQNGWSAPDTIVLPAGNGSLLLGAAIGFKELKNNGLIDTIPRIIAVQTERCAPLFSAWSETPFSPADEPGLAEGIAIAQPIRLRQMLKEVHESGGMVLTVNEKQIEQSYRDIGQRGFFIEPTSAAILAGTEKYIRSQAYPGERIATLFSGHGLKKII